MSISTLVKDDWWWRPDSLSFLQDLVKTVDEKLSPEEMKSLLIVALTEEMGERDLEPGNREDQVQF